MDDDDLKTGFRVGEWQVQPLLSELQSGDQTHHVEPKIMDVLLVLARHAGSVVERDAIIASVWGERFVSDDPLSKCIAELRKVLGDSAREPTYIQTVHKRGYRLLAQVSPLRRKENEEDAVSRVESSRTLVSKPLGSLVVVVLVLAIAVVAGSFIARNQDGGSDRLEAVENGRPVIAVLPFSGDNPDDEYLVVGLRNELMTALARNKAWRVLALSSVDELQQRQDQASFAEALGATNLLEAQLQRVDEQLRIRTQLIDAASGELLWAESFERDLTVASLLSVQRQIVARIASGLELELVTDSAGDPPLPTSNLEAYSAYLRARRAAAAESVESLTTAIAELDRAIELDPDFAAAHAAAADAYLSLGAYFLGGLSIEEAIEKAKPLLDRALALDPDIAEAHAASGLMEMLQRDAKAAEASLRRALDIQPSYARVYQLLGHLRWNQGRLDEAIQYAKQALELDRWSAAIILDLARYYDQSGLFQEAMTEYVRVVNIEPKNAFAPLHIAALKYLAFGDIADAIVWYHKAAATDRLSASVQSTPAIAYLELGDLDSARRFIDRGMAIDPNVFWVRIASMYYHQRKGDAPAAVEDARAIYAAYPKARDALRELMRHDIEAGSPSVALARFATAHPELTESEPPQVNPFNVFSAVDLAQLLIHMEQPEKASVLLDASLTTMGSMQRVGQNGYWINDARAFALLGRTDRALTALRTAIDEGWRVLCWYHLYEDPALFSLHGDPAFLSMREEIAEDLASQSAKLSTLKNSGALARIDD